MIKRIRIRDFKSIRELELELDPVTVLVGRTGTGKSNLVQAIRFLRNLLLNPREAVDYESGWSRIVPAGETEPRTSIEVCFALPGEQRQYDYQLAFGMRPQHVFPAPPMLMAERLSWGGERVFARTRGDACRWEWETPPRVSPVPAHEDDPMLGRFPSLSQVVFAYAALSTGVGFYHFPSTALAPSTGQPLGGSLMQMIPGLSDAAANYLQIMRLITQDFQRPDTRKNLLKAIHEVNRSIASIELDSLTSPQRAIIGHEAAGRIFELSLEQESDGLRRFYAHLLALYQTPSKLCLIFEEPENAIFPGALSVLAEEFIAAPRENRGQVILTTHNPVFLDSFDVENVRAVDMRDGKTIVGRVSKEQREAVKDKLLTTGELLTVDRARVDEQAPVQQPV